MTVRAALPSDAAEIAALTIELGYAGDEAAIRERLARILDRRDQKILVAVLEQTIAGWIQAHASDVLESGVRIEIVGLIVGGRFRRRGVGRALVEQIESWAAELGVETIVVRSNTQRLESHRFYPALGYVAAKQQAVYRKRLGKEPSRPPKAVLDCGQP
jgi:GNAT superfamily N-acetyltransferase